MKKHTFIFFVAAVASLAIAACGKEEPVGPASGGSDTIPTTDTIPAVDTLPAAPWYSSLIGTRWYRHHDETIGSIHFLEDIYWFFIDDSTLSSTIINLNEAIPIDTSTVLLSYTYNPNALECTLIYSAGEPEVYALDTIEKTLSSDPTLPIDQIVFHLIEE